MLFVLMFEWLTLLATRRCLPQTSQCAAISNPSGRRVPLALADGIRKQAPGANRGPPAGALVRDPGRLSLPADPAGGWPRPGRPTARHRLAGRRRFRPA